MTANVEAGLSNRLANRYDSEVDIGFAHALGMELGRNKSGRGGKVEMVVGCVSACVRGGDGVDWES